MQQELQRVQQEMRFEGAIEGLRKSDAGSADIDYSLSELSNVRDMTLPQARLVLNLAISNIPSWVETAGGEQVIAAVTPAIDIFRTQATATDDETLKSEFGRLSARVVSGIVMADSATYEQLAPQIQEGRFGEPSVVLIGAAQTLLVQGDRGQEFGDGDSGTIARVLDGIITLEDPNLIEPLKPALPLEWLDGDFGEQDLKASFPRVHAFLEQPLLRPDEKYIALARMFAAAEGAQRERLKERIKKGEFGENVLEAFGSVVGVLSSDETRAGSPLTAHALESATQDLWIECLEINRKDPRLRPLRERFLAKDWYWDEDIMYTIVETLDGMAIPVGEERDFILRHADTISSMFLNPNQWGDEWRRKYYDGVKLTQERGDLGERLAAVVGEVRETLKQNGGEPADVMPNGLFFASLYTPIEQDQPESKRIWLNSLPDVPVEHRSRIGKIILDALEEVRRQRKESSQPDTDK